MRIYPSLALDLDLADCSNIAKISPQSYLSLSGERFELLAPSRDDERTKNNYYAGAVFLSDQHAHFRCLSM